MYFTHIKDMHYLSTDWPIYDLHTTVLLYLPNPVFLSSPKSHFEKRFSQKFNRWHCDA